MPKYRATANVLNLRVGETFESDEEWYATIAKKGYLAVVPGDDAEVPTGASEEDPGPSGPPEEPEPARVPTSSSSKRRKTRESGTA